jgi:hypothetical protein
MVRGLSVSAVPVYGLRVSRFSCVCPFAVPQVPELYPYGSRGPIGAHYLGAKHNVRWGDSAA